jgi:hypothetical protein
MDLPWGLLYTVTQGNSKASLPLSEQFFATFQLEEQAQNASREAGIQY